MTAISRWGDREGIFFQSGLDSPSATAQADVHDYEDLHHYANGAGETARRNHTILTWQTTDLKVS